MDLHMPIRELRPLFSCHPHLLNVHDLRRLIS